MTVDGNDSHQMRASGDNLIPFPCRQDTAGEPAVASGHQPGDDLVVRDTSDVESVGPVYEAELVDDDPPGKAVGPVVRVFQPVIQPVVIVVRHDRTIAITKVIARNLVYVATGAGALAKRGYDRRTKYDRYERAAEIAGNQEDMRYWEERGEKAKDSRHKRRLERAELMWRRTKRLALYFPVAAMLLLFLGVAVAAITEDWSWVAAPLVSTVKAVGWTVYTAVHLAVWLVVLAVALFLGVLWSAGRRYGEIPRWAATQATRIDHEDIPITPSIVVTALRDLGIPVLRKAIVKMGDAGAAMLGPISLAGCGVEVDVTLPSGVTTLEVQRKRRKLAENLHRHEHELFITIPQAARTVRLWIADPGALDEPIGPSPLVMDEDMTADVFTQQAPWGQDLRGDRVALPLLMRHLLITGLSNQGKTAALRALVLWLVLDPTVELRIADLKGVGDWRMFDKLATTFIQGPTDEHVIAATEMLEEGVREMERRIADLEASGATDGVTRKMASSGGGFHPLFLIVDEAQVAFMCPARDPAGAPYGGTKATSRYFMAARKLHNQGRAVLVHLWQGTQDPTNENLPKLVREGAHIRAALVLGTEEQSRMAVGDKAVNGGAAPHELRQGLDKGTLVVSGDGVPLPPGQASITIRTHFINGQAAVEVAERVVERRGPVRISAAEDEVRDLLDDVAAVLNPGEDKVRATDVCSRLRELAPHYRPYVDLTAERLRDRLGDEGCKVTKVGVLVVFADRVFAALAAREGTDPSC